MDYYYLDNDNYKDDLPFDLYNMFSLAKRIDFKEKLDLGLKDITKEVLLSQYETHSPTETLEDLATKHLPKLITEDQGEFFIQP